METDAREEELRVVWELEQRPVIRDQYALPSPAAGFDAPDRLDAFLDAVRWGAIASADRTTSRRRSAPAWRSRTTSSTPLYAPCPCPAPTC